jgi:hypothetical protein
MPTTAEWNSLIYLKPEDFSGKNPDGLRFSILQKLDRFIHTVGSRPVILSAYRPGDPKAHGYGEAIDTTWPGQDPLKINQMALDSGLFKGVGIYVNEIGAASHHFDDWDKRTGTDPATWGGIITHPIDSTSGQHVRVTQYVTMTDVVTIIKKKLWQVATSPVGLLLAALLLIGLLKGRSR